MERLFQNSDRGLYPIWVVADTFRNVGGGGGGGRNRFSTYDFTHQGESAANQWVKTFLP